MFNVWKWDMTEKKVIIGLLVLKKPNMPPYGKRLYGFEFDNGEVWYVWGTKVLVGELAALNFKTKVRIEFLGKGRDSPTEQYDKLLFDVKILQLPSKVAEKKKKSNDKKRNNAFTRPPRDKGNSGVNAPDSKGVGEIGSGSFKIAIGGEEGSAEQAISETGAAV